MAVKRRKHAGGRPSLGDAGLTQVVSIKVSRAILPTWRAAAEKQGQSLGEWLREAAELALARGATR
jgi:hypothetical protein